MKLSRVVGEAIAQHQLWSPGDRVAVAVSGGVDSVALLDLLLETRGWHGGELSVVTVDHDTRPTSSEDAAHVQALAADRGLPVTRVDLVLGSASSQAACRAARYRAYEAVDADRIALAHHRDDQAETILIHLLRGTSPAGLEGMASRRGRFVRPLLQVPREALVAHARECGLAWREDPTNRDPRYLRTRIRHEVLPLLEDLRPSATAALARSATLAGAQGAYLDTLLADVPDPWSRAWIAEGPEPLVRRFLHRTVPGLRTAHADALLAAARRGHGAVALPEGRLVVAGGRVQWAEDARAGIE